MISATVWSCEVAVVGRGEVEGGGEIAVAIGVDVRDGDAADLFGRVGVVKRATDATAGVGLGR